MQPLLSIVIPTKNRQRFCLSAVKSILAINDERIQIVVQDNSDVEILQEQLPSGYSESRLKYKYHKGAISFVNNFNMAIENATGEYICIIGDDDGVNPEIIDAVEWARNNNVDCLTGSMNASYRWDDVGDRRKFHIRLPASSLMITGFTSKFQDINPQVVLHKFMQNGATNYTEFNFPKLYHGIVSRDSLENLKKQTGNYLKGLSPDIYASIALACTIKRFVWVDYPLTIPGVCAQSGSIIEGEKKENDKSLSNAPHFKGRSEPYIWEKMVPEIYCVQTIWADSAFAAIKALRQDDLLSQFNDFMLAYNIIHADASLTKLVESYLQKRYTTKNIIHIRYKLNIIKYNHFINKSLLNYISKFRKVTGFEEFKIIPNLLNMEEAATYLKDYLDKSGRSFKMILQNKNLMNNLNTQV